MFAWKSKASTFAGLYLTALKACIFLCELYSVVVAFKRCVLIVWLCSECESERLLYTPEQWTVLIVVFCCIMKLSSVTVFINLLLIFYLWVFWAFVIYWGDSWENCLCMTKDPPHLHHVATSDLLLIFSNITLVATLPCKIWKCKNVDSGPINLYTKQLIWTVLVFSLLFLVSFSLYCSFSSSSSSQLSEHTTLHPSMFISQKSQIRNMEHTLVQSKSEWCNKTQWCSNNYTIKRKRIKPKKVNKT